MSARGSGKLLTAAGVLCFAVAFVVLNVFRGEFGKDTAGLSTELPVMEDTIDVTPKPEAESGGAPERLASVAQSAAPSQKWVVYVTGAVRNPGVYEVAAQSRVYEALNAAGGFASDADQEAVNLAALLQDGVHIKFPRKGETQQAPGAAPYQQPSSDAGSSGSAPRASGKININRATAAELDSLAGIGPKTAAAIIAYRSANGPFRRTEDLMNVRGIGPKKFDAIKDEITIDG